MNFESEKLNFRYLGRCGHLNMMLLMSYSISSSLFSFASFECLPLNFGGVAHQNLGLGHQNRRLGISTVNFSSPRQSKRQNFSQFFIFSSSFSFLLFSTFFSEYISPTAIHQTKLLSTPIWYFIFWLPMQLSFLTKQTLL